MEYNTKIAVDSSFASFQSVLEYVFELAKTKRIVLVVVSYMEDHVLAYKAPLYGRRTAQLKIKPSEV